MGLITVAQLKLRIKVKATETSLDTLLAGIISGVGALFDRELHRTLIGPAALADATETLDGGGFDALLRYWPITRLTSVKLATDWDFDTAEALTEKEDFYLNTVRGVVTCLPLGNRWPDGPGILQVKYLGGYAAASDPEAVPEDPPEDPPTLLEETVTLPALPDHIVEAALQQAADLYDRHSHPGAGGSWDTGTVAAGTREAIQLLPSVKTLLKDEGRFF